MRVYYHCDEASRVLLNSKQTLKLKKLKIAGVCGVLTPIIVLTLILLAIHYSPWFSWTENALSDLGVQGTAAILFNSSLIVGGVLTIIFAIGLREILLDKTLGRIGTLIFILDGAIFCAIGIFPKTTGSIHFYVSVAFFMLLPVSLFLCGVAMMQESSGRKIGLFTIIAGIVAASVWILQWNAVAIPEMIAALAAFVWSIVLGIRMFMQASRFQVQSG
jgi:hypothetical membrane protein